MQLLNLPARIRLRHLPHTVSLLLLIGITVTECPAVGRWPRRTPGPDAAPHVTLRRFARAHDFARPRPDANEVILRNDRHEVRLQLDSRLARVNGVTVWLHQPVIQHRRNWLIAETDVQRVLNPILRPAEAVAGVGHRVILLDPGHGGSDTGGRSPHGLLEKELVLEISRKVADQLGAMGMEVHLTRTTDTTLSLEQRVQRAAEIGADLFVSIHLNTAANTGAHGTETFVLTAGGEPSTANQDNGSFPPATPANEFDTANQLLGYFIQRNVLHTTGNLDRGLRRSRFRVLREAVCPAVLVECAFLTHPEEEQKLKDPAYREKLAQGISNGIREYLRECRLPPTADRRLLLPPVRAGRLAGGLTEATGEGLDGAEAAFLGDGRHAGGVASP